MEFSVYVSVRSNEVDFDSPASFEFACGLFREAVKKGKKLDLGEKLFLIQTARSISEIPFSLRPRSLDNFLGDLLSVGVIDYTSIPKGTDRIVDYFYRNPERAKNNFGKM